MELAGKLYALFAVTGAVAGLISTFVPDPKYALLIAIILFYFSYKIIPPHALKVKHSDWPGGKRNIATSGFFPFFLMWLIVWILLYTVFLLERIKIF
jgi:hypothetical protein